MIVGVCTIELYIPGSGSLKDKRSKIKSIIARLRNEFNLSVAEVGDQDRRQSAVLGLACISSDPDYVHGLLLRAVQYVERERLDCQLVDYSIEMS